MKTQRKSKMLKTKRPNSLFTVPVQTAADRAGVHARTVYRKQDIVEIRKDGPGETCEGFLTEEDTLKLIKMYEIRRQRKDSVAGSQPATVH